MNTDRTEYLSTLADKIATEGNVPYRVVATLLNTVEEVGGTLTWKLPEHNLTLKLNRDRTITVRLTTRKMVMERYDW